MENTNEIMNNEIEMIVREATEPYHEEMVNDAKVTGGVAGFGIGTLIGLGIGWCVVKAKEKYGKGRAKKNSKKNKDVVEAEFEEVYEEYDEPKESEKK